MPHLVKCKCCGKQFDRDKDSYVVIGYQRYAHPKCYESEMEKNPKLNALTVINPLDNVECFFCKKVFNKELNPFVIYRGKYAHPECLKADSLRQKSEQEVLDDYICDLFKIDFVTPRIRKQINQYIKDYNYSYTGILRTLKFFYEIRKNNVDKANNGIGIVPYVYQEAYNYFYSLWLADQKNNSKDISQFIPKIIEVTIPPPQAKIEKRKLFTFLDEEEIDAK